jgi:threonine/homoserine/homoserine lactone efflux protein
MDVILKGIVSGIALALLIGPVFFTILQTSIERGFRSGALVAAGVSISDTFYIILCYLGLSSILESDRAQHYLAYIGGSILLCFGCYYLLVKSRRPLDFRAVNIRSGNSIRLMAKGFIINGLSPMVLVFWLGMVSVARGEFGYAGYRAFVFFTSVVTTVLVTDLLKAKMADHLRRILTVQFIRTLNILLGILMIVFAGRLLLYGGDLHFS